MFRRRVVRASRPEGVWLRPGGQSRGRPVVLGLATLTFIGDLFLNLGYSSGTRLGEAAAAALNIGPSGLLRKRRTECTGELADKTP